MKNTSKELARVLGIHPYRVNQLCNERKENGKSKPPLFLENEHYEWIKNKRIFNIDKCQKLYFAPKKEKIFNQKIDLELKLKEME